MAAMGMFTIVYPAKMIMKYMKFYEIIKNMQFNHV